jgi:hypothetical protein
MGIQIGVTPVNIIPINLLPTVTGLDMQHWFVVGKPTGSGNDNSYKVEAQALATMIGEQIGQVTVPNQKFYRVKDAEDGVNPITGEDTVNDVAIVDWDYFLDKRGVGPMEKGIDWQNDVVGGGWRLLGGAKFVKGEVYTATPKPAVSNILASSDAVGRFVSGVKVVNASGPIVVTDFRKLIVIAGANTVSLPLASAYPKNVMLPITTVDGPQKQCTINTQGADKIYNSGTGVSKFYMNWWQSVFLVTPDNINWYMMPGSDNVFKNPYLLGGGWMVGINQLAAIGAEYPRADYPGVWDFILRLKAATPAAVKSSSTWGANRSYWGEGNNTTTFNTPDLRGDFLRFLDMGRGVDIDRSNAIPSLSNIPGSWQDQSVLSHYHYTAINGTLTTNNLPDEISRDVTNVRAIMKRYIKSAGVDKVSYYLGGGSADYTVAGSIPDIGPTSSPKGANSGTGSEERARNSAFIPLINLT